MNPKNFHYLILLLLLQSCSCIQFKLTKAERQWCSYKNNEMLIFKSNKGNIDTLKVSDRYESYSNENCNYVEVSRKQINSLSVNLSLESKTKTALASNVSITKNPDSEFSYPELNFFGLTSNLEHEKFMKEKVRLSTNHKIYDQVYVVRDSVNGQNIDSYLAAFYYDQEDGLIRYDAKDGEKFELLKRQ